MHSITLSQLAKIDIIDDVEIHSLDCSLYTARLVIGDQQYRLLDNNYKPYRRRSTELIKKDLLACQVGSIALVHQSAYDEMVGQPVGRESNQLRVSLAKPSL